MWNRASDQSQSIASRTRTFIALASTLTAAFGISIFFFIYTAWQTPVWPAFAMVALSLVMAAFSGTAALLVRRGRLYGGGLLLFATLVVGMPFIPALVPDVGLPVAMILTPALVIILEMTLSHSHSRRGIFVAIVSLVLTLTVNLFWPWKQLTVPHVQSFVWMMGVLVMLVETTLLFRQLRDYSLQAKIMVVSITVVIISLVLMNQAYRTTSRRIFTQIANQSLLDAAERVALEIDTFITETKHTLQSQATIPDFVEYMAMPPAQRTGSTLEKEVQTLLQIFKQQAGTYILTYGLVNTEGKVVLDASPSITGNNEGDRDYIQQPLQTGEAYVSPIEFSPRMGGASWYFAAPIRDETGQVIGVLRVEYAPTLLQQMVRRFNTLAGPESFPILFDENHLYLAQGTISETPLYILLTPITDPARLMALRTAYRLPFLPTGSNTINRPDLATHLENAKTEPTFSITGFPTASQTQQVAVANLTTLPWQVAFFQPRDVFLANIKTQERVTLLLSPLLTGIAVAMAVGAAQYLVQPIARLTATARRVAEGDLSAQAPVETQDEIGQLGEAFNTMTARLRQLIGSLEEQVQERTQELTYSIEVGQRAAAIRDLNLLLPTITEMIRERFSLYYVQVYFVDDLRKNLVLKWGTGSAGKMLLARQFSLPVGPGSIAGQVAATGKSIIVSDTATSSLYKPIDLLPDIRSEMAVPLIVEGEVIGVLDLEDNRPGTFTEQNRAVFEAMATQFAIAIDSARQWTLAQEARHKAEQAVRQLMRESWQQKLRVMRAEEGYGFAYDLSTVTPLRGNGDGGSARPVEKARQLTTPLRVQNQVIGYLSASLPPESPVTEDEEALLQAVAQQLAQKVETLRLFEDTQQRAAREKLLADVTARVWASGELEQVMQSAVEQLGHILDASKVVIRLGTEAELLSEG